MTRAVGALACAVLCLPAFAKGREWTVLPRPDDAREFQVKHVSHREGVRTRFVIDRKYPDDGYLEAVGAALNEEWHPCSVSKNGWVAKVDAKRTPPVDLQVNGRIWINRERQRLLWATIHYESSPATGAPTPANDTQRVDVLEIEVSDTDDYARSMKLECTSRDGEDDVILPKSLYIDDLPFPETLRKFKMEAKLQYAVVIRTNGRVGEIRLESCSTRTIGEWQFVEISLDACGPIDDEAREALSKRRYMPAMKKGQPVAVWGRLFIEYRLHR